MKTNFKLAQANNLHTFVQITITYRYRWTSANCFKNAYLLLDFVLFSLSDVNKSFASMFVFDVIKRYFVTKMEPPTALNR